MARKPTPQQITVLARLEAGWPLEALPLSNETRPATGHLLLAKHNCMEGRVMLTHRTIKTDSPSGSKVQAFRINPDGTFTQHLG
jgi:hypothetical protein